MLTCAGGSIRAPRQHTRQLEIDGIKVVLYMIAHAHSSSQTNKVEFLKFTARFISRYLEMKRAVNFFLMSNSAHATAVYDSIRQHTAAYGSTRQHTSAYIGIRQHTSAYVSIQQHKSAYVSIRQHTSAYVSIRHLQVQVRDAT